MGMFELFDYVVAKVFMPVGSLLMCVFLGWVVKERVVRDEVTNGGQIKTVLYPVWLFIIRYVAPVCIVLIFAKEVGAIKL